MHDVVFIAWLLSCVYVYGRESLFSKRLTYCKLDSSGSRQEQSVSVWDADSVCEECRLVAMDTECAVCVCTGAHIGDGTALLRSAEGCINEWLCWVEIVMLIVVM